MKSKKVFAAVLTAAILTTSVLSGCGKKTEVTPPSTTSIDADQTLNIVGYDYTSLDPSKVSDAESMTSYQQIYEGLTREVTKDGKLTTELAGAKSIDKNADGTVYTVKLRDGVKWSDGVPVKAQDYIYSWTKLADPATGADYMSFLGDEMGLKGAAEFSAGTGKKEGLGLKAIDDNTLEVTLAHPNPYFESVLAFKLLVPQRQDVEKALGDKYGQDFAKMVYNGPFVISEYAKGSKIVYKKNANYWDAKSVKLETANCPIINETATLVQMFQNKELDQTGASGDNIAKLDANKAAGGYDHITGTTASVFYYVFNTQSPVLKNKNVRLALSLAYDRQEQINVVWKRFIPAFGIVPSKIAVGDKEYRKDVTEPLKEVKDDPKTLLATGLQELGLTADKVKLTLLFGPQTSTGKAQGEYIQKKWKDLGVNVDVKFSVDSPSYFKDRSKGNFDICAGGWGADYNDVASYFVPFTTGNGNNNGKFSDPAYDNLVKQAGSELDTVKREALYKQAEELLLVKDAAISTYFYQDVHTFRYNYLKGLYTPMFGGYYELRQAYIQGRAK